jgi:hypothetical protein
VTGFATDPDGRRVELADERWRHITTGHPELGDWRADVLRTVQHPDHWMQGRMPSEGWFYAEGVGPSRWLKVVVHYEHGVGHIVTAFARRSMP